MAVNRQLVPALGHPVAHGGHGLQNALFAFVGGELGEAAFTGQLDVHAHPVAQQPDFIDKLGGSAGNGFDVDVSRETIRAPQQFQHPAHTFH